jgi:tetratricopeptide (TPR) repeat protein
MLYGSQGRFDEALAILDRGKQSDALLPTLAASEILVHCWRRDFDSAVRLGRHAIELHPHLQVVRANYGQALQFAGRPAEAIGQYQIASILSPDVLWLRALEGACQAVLGRGCDARAILEGLEAIRRSQYVDAYYMSVFRSALGQRREAIAELERAFTESSAWLYALDVDPQLDAIRDQPKFRRLRQRLRRYERRDRPA